MRKHTRAALLCVAAALTLTACAAGKGGGASSDAAAAPGKDDKLTLTVWSNYSDRELVEVTKALKTFNKKFPNIEIKHEGSQDDDKITAGIRSGNTPDVALSFTTDNIGQFCSSGAFQPLKAYIDRDKVDLNQLSPAVQQYTEYKGNRCAMPMLTDVYAMYYNKDLLSAAGVTNAPKTLDELYDAAVKATKKAPNGDIEVAGYLPTMGFYANRPTILAPTFGAEWEKDGKSGLASSPGFTEMMTFQKKLVDFYGYDALERFRAGLGQEYSADHAFHQGKIAIMIDGEYRTAFLKAQAPQIKFGTAPFPTWKPADYGTAFTTGTIMGIPKGAKNAGAAWELIKHLTFDTDTIVDLSNAIKNVPSTKAAMESPKLEVDEQFKTFIDLAKSDKLKGNPVTPIGDAHIKAVTDFSVSYQSGKVPDLAAGLKEVDKNIDDQIAKSGK
ncbi:ABC transporter substrate-binding protein [Lentzea flaviverrucosa]|uniref:Multiple sugar transport system substrate-binding protein n=1 Tax=Lentzea flaviverrucosa TaxID=200379 RepID=A0A1H9X5N3_9PSEU|nr:ABC transporter substrate-binding protein [Lentzea flaviverrucosa]RDI20804.1 carbohydrate ABC transporter substrate-binding protein (CUT1 family) [Lentzea flaviverrucosa]SES41460.1 multiple sugar transport system substrate-binding protein [Lentzea flaviverrucosa]